MGRRTGQHTTLPFFPARTHTLLASLLDRLSASPRLVVQSLKGVSGDIIVLEEVRRRIEYLLPRFHAYDVQLFFRSVQAAYCDPGLISGTFSPHFCFSQMLNVTLTFLGVSSVYRGHRAASQASATLLTQNARFVSIQ